MDDLNLLHDAGEPCGPRRPPWALLAGIAVVALLALAGVAWVIDAVGGDGGRPVASPTAASGTTGRAPPTPTAAPTTARRTPAPLPSAASVLVAPTTAPRASATTRSPAPRRVTPSPRPTATAGLVRVPDVLGQRIRSATATLEAAGFRVAVLGGNFKPGGDERRVIAQQPAPGALVPAGSTVLLITDGI